MSLPGAALPWRGPGPGRPDLPLPPGRMPILRRRRPLKRWRYVAAYGEELMLCAGRVRIGPLGQTFWAVWDRESRRLVESTRLRLPLPGGQVRMGEHSLRFRGKGLRVALEMGELDPVEVVCPNGDDGYVWTRKRSGIPMRVWVETGGRVRELEMRGAQDETAGYHSRRTSWLWSAGVGVDRRGRAVGWNLVTGVNDPRTGSERAIWIDGEPSEPGPVSFEGLEAVGFEDGSRLEFAAESERARSDDLKLFASRYRQPFGTFTGTLPGVELERGWGVMEQHEALW